MPYNHIKISYKPGKIVGVPVNQGIEFLKGSLDLAKYNGRTLETIILREAIKYLFSAMTSFPQYVGKAEPGAGGGLLEDGLGRSSWDKVWIVSAVICICFTGTIGFIGLVSPHITRMVASGRP